MRGVNMLDFPFILSDDSPLKITKGSYYSKTFRWTSDSVAQDITGFKFESQFREKYKSDSPIVTLTTENSGIVLTDPSDGTFSLLMTIAQTDLFTVPLSTAAQTDIPYKDYVFDIDAIPVDTTKRFNFLKGVARVYAEVTRA
jgi:hypothetical protein